jgi:menaquinone-9 beta-reductase
MKKNNKKEILIVGSGPAGLSTWLHLYKNNPELAKKSLMIDKEKFPREKVCAGGLGAWSNKILRSLELEIDIPSILISNIEFINKEKKMNINQKNCFEMVDRSEFDYFLLKHSIKKGLDINENEFFIDYAKDNDYLIVKTNRGNYKIKTLVGADGSLSNVRNKINLKENSNLAKTLETFSIVNPKIDTEYEMKKNVVDLSYINEGLQGYLWHVPCIKKGIPMICHGIVDFQINKKSKFDMINIFKNELDLRNTKINKNMLLSHPIRWPSDKDNISDKNILLVGDAVGIEPAFGGGIHFALSYGKFAANEIDEAYQKNDFSYDKYKEKYSSHPAIIFRDKCIEIAHKMYNKEMDPFEAAKKVFTI